MPTSGTQRRAGWLSGVACCSLKGLAWESIWHQGQLATLGSVNLSELQHTPPTLPRGPGLVL